MSKKLFSLLETLAEFASVYYKDDEGGKLYSLYSRKARYIVTDFQTNLNHIGDGLIKLRILFQSIEINLYRSNIPIYYIKFPYSPIPHEPDKVGYDQFIKDSYKFYENLGNYDHLALGNVMLFFGEEIIELLKTYHAENTLFSPDFERGGDAKTLEGLYILLRENEKEIFERFKDHYYDLTQKQLKECLETLLRNKKVGGHLLNQMWYLVNRSKK